MNTAPIDNLIAQRRDMFAEFNRLRRSGVPWSSLIQMDRHIAELDAAVGGWAGLQPAEPILITES